MGKEVSEVGSPLRRSSDLANADIGSATAQAIPSSWTINQETAIVYEVNAGSGLTNVRMEFGVDNGIFVWLDGAYPFGAVGPGAAIANEYNVALGNLSAGTHFLQVLREDHGGITGHDILVSADASRVEPVPEPGSLSLVGAGALVILASLRRRRFRQSPPRAGAT
jgi:hypothetical protein